MKKMMMKTLAVMIMIAGMSISANAANSTSANLQDKAQVEKKAPAPQKDAKCCKAQAKDAKCAGMKDCKKAPCKCGKKCKCGKDCKCAKKGDMKDAKCCKKDGKCAMKDGKCEKEAGQCAKMDGKKCDKACDKKAEPKK